MGSGLIDPRWDRSSPNPHAKPSARLVGGIIKEREREPQPPAPAPSPSPSPKGTLLGKGCQAKAVSFRRHFATLPIHVAPSFSARLQTAVSLGPKEGATTHHSITSPDEVACVESPRRVDLR